MHYHQPVSLPSCEDSGTVSSVKPESGSPPTGRVLHTSLARPPQGAAVPRACVPCMASKRITGRVVQRHKSSMHFATNVGTALHT
eukprot:364768-Chlamydomonas_euryale.AAC.5